MWLSRYFVLFVIFSCMGWVYETLYCTIKTKKWENRGFLYGPLCPIYGTGAVAATIVVDLVSGVVTTYTYTWWQVFLVAFFGSIVLEYVTSWGLEKMFHAYWWDYSNVPLNINGRVCFPASCGFGLAGLLVVYVILPYTEKATAWVTPIEYELFGLIFMSVVSIDTTLTVSALTNFAKRIETFENALNSHMDQFVININEGKYAPNVLISEGKQAAAQKLENSKEAAMARLEDNRQAAQSILEESRLSMEERLQAERERFSKENMEQLLSSFGSGSNAALRRVEGFRMKKNSVENENTDTNNRILPRFGRKHVSRMNEGLKVLKEKHRSRKSNV